MDLDREAKIRLRHLTQLKRVPATAGPGGSSAIPRKQHAVFDWIRAAVEQCLPEVQRAVERGARGSKESVDWDIALLTLLEGVVVYLRDSNLVRQAAAAARLGQEEHAKELLRQSDAPIRAMAQLWNMDYITICDLVDEHAEDDWMWDGPFCGIFVSCNPDRPFAGLAFKGTVSTSIPEIMVDLAYEPVLSSTSTLPNVHISKGVYATMFEPFASLDGKTPFDYIVTQLEGHFGPKNMSYKLHATGHSLGASYANLFHAAALSISGSSSLSVTIRDLWTFGCPRVGLTDFATLFGSLMRSHDGVSWRIVNSRDPVPRVPPNPLDFSMGNDVFCHIDRAMRVHKDGEPEAIESEIGRGPDKLSLPVTFDDHFMTSYYTSVYFAAVRNAPKEKHRDE